MENKDSFVELELVAGMSGYGKTQYVVDKLDRQKPILVLDFRGQVAEKFQVRPMQSRLEIIEELQHNPVPFIIYQPGFEDYEIEQDIEFFLVIALCMKDSQIFIDEIDFELKPTEYPKEFRKVIASARTQHLSIFVTAHRLKECPLKLRALGKKIIFHLEEESDLEYLKGLQGFNEEKIKSLPYYQYIVLPVAQEKPPTLPIDK